MFLGICLFYFFRDVLTENIKENASTKAEYQNALEFAEFFVHAIHHVKIRNPD